MANRKLAERRAAILRQADAEGYSLLEYRGGSHCNFAACPFQVKTAGVSHPLGICKVCLTLAFPEYKAALARIERMSPPPLPGPKPGPTQEWLGRQRASQPVCGGKTVKGEPCLAYPNSRGYCGRHWEGRVEYYTQTELRTRGWRPSAIAALLGEPDWLGGNPYYKSAAPTKLWRADRVQAAEQQTPEPRRTK